MNNSIFVSVIINIYSDKRYDFLLKLLSYLNIQSYKFFEVIIIVDNNKTLHKKITSIIPDYNLSIITILNEDKIGLSYGRNLGIKNSKGSIIAFIDDDALPNTNWVEKIVETFSDSSLIGSVVGDVIPLWEDPSQNWLPRELFWMISCSYTMTPINKQEVDRGFGVNMAFRKDVLDIVGMFNTKFGISGNKWVGGEDTDMFMRIRSNGNLIIFNPEIKVQHFVPANRLKITKIFKRAYDSGYSIVMVNKYRQIKNSKEDNYFLNYIMSIIFNFYPMAIKNVFFHPILSIKQIIVLSTVIVFEFLGFIAALFYYFGGAGATSTPP